MTDAISHCLLSLWRIQLCWWTRPTIFQKYVCTWHNKQLYSYYRVQISVPNAVHISHSFSCHPPVFLYMSHFVKLTHQFPVPRPGPGPEPRLGPCVGLSPHFCLVDAFITHSLGTNAHRNCFLLLCKFRCSCRRCSHRCTVVLRRIFNKAITQKTSQFCSVFIFNLKLNLKKMVHSLCLYHICKCISGTLQIIIQLYASYYKIVKLFVCFPIITQNIVKK